MLAIEPAHREPRTFGDWAAWRLIKLCRWGMDVVTGLGPEQQVDMKHSTTSTAASKPLTEGQWVRMTPTSFYNLHRLTTRNEYSSCASSSSSP